MTIRPYGDRALLIETGPEQVLAVAARLRRVAGVVEVAPAARTVLARIDPLLLDRPEFAAAVEPGGGPVAGTDADPTEPVLLPVRYDGPDLALVAQTAGCSVAEVIRRHTAAVYTVAFCGFAPGFGYLSGLDPSLHQPRLAAPRVAVPRGAVGIAGEFSGVYPRRSPGGWRLLGTTSALLWDPVREPPALLSPGIRVRFVAASVA